MFSTEETGAPKTKTSVKKNIVTILLVLVAAVAVAAALWLYKNPPTSQNNEQTDVSSDLESILVTRKITSIPYMPTGIDSVVYTADAAGNVVYYTFDGKEFTELAPTGTMHVDVSLSGQKIPADIPYVERDGALTGFGVFMQDGSDADVYIHNFVMFKICNLPTACAQNGKCLLLLHTDRTQTYTLDPVWEEAYVLDRSTGATTRFLDSGNPSLDASGAQRTDFGMLTDEALTADTASIPFLSGRAYDRQENGETPVDIYLKKDLRPVSAVQNVADKYVKPLSGGGFVFLRNTEGGFESFKYENGKESRISTFYAHLGTSFMRNGDYLLSKEDGRIYTTYDDTVISTKGYKINPLLFAVSPDGKYIVMAGTVANALDYRIYVYNTQTENYMTFPDPNYAAHTNLRFVDNTTVTYCVLNVDGYENVVLDLSKVK